VTKTIQIRDVPDDVHATLRARAAQAGMSLSDFLLHKLEGYARRPAVAEVLERAQSRGGSGPSVEDIVAAVREARDRED
jgi:predicted CopG family antitoxin